MPFKDRLKQLRYMRKHSKERRELLRDCMAKQKLKQDLERKMVFFAREFLQERHNYPIEPIPNYKYGRRLEKTFMIDSEDALKSAVQAVCNAEDEYIRKTIKDKHMPEPRKARWIGIVQDMQISLLNEKTGLVWEIISNDSVEEVTSTIQR